MNGNRRTRVTLACLFLAFTLVLASCQQAAMRMETGPLAWVGGPPDGSEVPLGVVTAMCHAYARAGVSHIELWVNGVFANRAQNTADPSAEYFTESLTFETTGPGSYVLHCWTFDQDGGSGQSDPVTLRVTGEEPTPTEPGEEIPTATPTSTEAPPTATVPVPTGTPLPPTETRIPPTSTRVPPTSTPRLPTPTPVPIRILSFEVSQSQITLGDCVRFDWVVQGSPDAIFFDGEGVTSPDARERCPTATREFELRAEVGDQVADRATLTVVVIQPSPTTDAGPSITNVTESANDMNYPDARCDKCPYFTYVTISANIFDPDGVVGPKLTYRIVQGGQWQSLPMNQTQTALYSATIDGAALRNSLDPPVPGGAPCVPTTTLQYYVQARDGLRNQSQSPTGTVTVHYCYIIR